MLSRDLLFIRGPISEIKQKARWSTGERAKRKQLVSKSAGVPDLSVAGGNRKIVCLVDGRGGRYVLPGDHVHNRTEIHFNDSRIYDLEPRIWYYCDRE